VILVPFWKVEAVGNDFVLVHIDDLHEVAAKVREELRLNELVAAGNVASAPCQTEHVSTYGLEELLPELALKACERKFGIGSDGLLTVERVAGGVSMRMFNPDGTEDFCGNGLRCAALHARLQGWVDESFNLFHGGRTIPAQVHTEGTISTDIGSASYKPSDVPHTQPHELFNTEIVPGYVGSAITMGSTHTILRVSEFPDEDTFQEVSAKLEHDPRFPLRTSIIWTSVVDDDHLRVRIWERGVGETLGCGTGASAAVADHMRFRGYGGEVRVESKGGEITISADAWDAPLTSRSTAKELFSGKFRLSG
jgi:diaminopimelate epimerase